MATRSRLVPALALLFAVATGEARSQDIVWENVLVDEHVAWNAVVPVAGGGTVSVASAVTAGIAPRLFVTDWSGAVLSQALLPGGQWQPTFDGVPDGAGGALFVGSEGQGGIGGQTLGTYDVVVFRCDASGQITWATRLGGSCLDFGHALARGAGGELFVAGSTCSATFGNPAGGDPDAFVARLDASGQVQWVRRVGQANDGGEFTALAPDGQGGVLCGGGIFDYGSYPYVPTNLVVGYDGAGNQLFRHDDLVFDGSATAIAVHPAGHVQLAQSPWGGEMCQAFDAQGQLLWTAPFAPGAVQTRLIDLADLGDGTYVLAGEAREVNLGPYHRHFTRFDASGAILADRSFPYPSDRDSYVHCMTADGFGGAYVGGALYATSGASQPSTWVGRTSFEGFGVPGCAGQPNSTGDPAETLVLGSPERADDLVTAYTRDLPPSTVGYYLMSMTTGFVHNPPGSQGDLCLGGTIGRQNRAGEVRSSGAEGRFHLLLDLDDIALPGGSVVIQAGETWHMQAWYRDKNPQATSNFSSSVAFTTQ